MFTTETLSFEIIPFVEWRTEIAPLWNMESAVSRIAMVLNGHGQLRFAGRELFERMLLFPIAARLEGRRVAWTSIYNISDSALRVRGIYVLPELRSFGIGRRMVAFAEELWPPGFSRTLMYARASNICRYQRWGFSTVPEHELRAFELEESIAEPGVQLMSRTRLAHVNPEPQVGLGQQESPPRHAAADMSRSRNSLQEHEQWGAPTQLGLALHRSSHGELPSP
jgi:GNAT superfamily N-acetyltransferase